MIITGQQNENQRTPEWIQSRMGRFSCSQLHRLMTEPKAKADKEAGKLSDGAITYVMECIAEKLKKNHEGDGWVHVSHKLSGRQRGMALSFIGDRYVNGFQYMEE